MSMCYASSGDRPDSPAHDDAVQIRSHDDVQRNPIQNRRSVTTITGRGSSRRHASVSSKGKSDEKSNKSHDKRWKNQTEPENNYRYRLSNRCLSAPHKNQLNGERKSRVIAKNVRQQKSA